MFEAPEFIDYGGFDSDYRNFTRCRPRMPNIYIAITRNSCGVGNDVKAAMDQCRLYVGYSTIREYGSEPHFTNLVPGEITYFPVSGTLKVSGSSSPKFLRNQARTSFADETI
jgi:hypothetical protein